MLRYILVFLVAAPFLTAQVNNPLPQIIKDAQNSVLLKQAQWSLFAMETGSGKILIDEQSSKSLAPASGLKLFSTAAALDVLGEDFRFETKLFYDGRITKDGSLKGNIYIVGGADPTLGSDMVDGSPGLDSLMGIWRAALVNSGIKKIEGALLAEDRLFSDNPVPDDWFFVDIGNYYGAGTSALSIHDNLYYLYFKPGKRIGAATKVIRCEPPVDGLSFSNFVTTAGKRTGDNAYIYCAPGQYSAALRGTIPLGRNEFAIKGSIPEPALFTVQYLRKYLIASGIPVSGEAARAGQTKISRSAKKIHVLYSPPLKDIVYMINKRSINLYTEQLVKMMAVRKGRTGSTREGIKTIYQFLDDQNISRSGLKLQDGCGLSRSNMISTRSVVQLLTAMSKHSAFDSFYRSLAVAGDPGDIGFFKNFGNGSSIACNARIKSGLIRGVRSHSGYLEDRSGDLIAFSFIANNFNGPTRNINRIHKKLLIALANRP